MIFKAAKLRAQYGDANFVEQARFAQLAGLVSRLA